MTGPTVLEQLEAKLDELADAYQRRQASAIDPSSPTMLVVELSRNIRDARREAIRLMDLYVGRPVVLPVRD